MIEEAAAGGGVAIVLAVISMIGTVGSGVFLLMTKILKTPKDQLEAKKLTLDEKKLEDEANAALLARFERLLSESDAKHGQEIRELKAEHAEEITNFRRQLLEFENKFIEQEGRYRAVVEFAYRLIRSMREHGLHEQLEKLSRGKPDGIHFY